MAMAGDCTVTRRGALAMISAVACAAVLPVVAEPEDTVAEIMRALAEAPPMKRLFFKQQVYSYSDGERSIFDDNLSPEDVHAAFNEWRDGFHPEVIALIESGKWKV